MARRVMRHAIVVAVVANRTGRRTVRLDDGQEITFSLDVCAFNPHVDQSVWVEVDPTGTHAASLSDLPDAARAEGWLSFDWRYPLGDCLRDVADLVDGRPLLILLDAQERLTTERGYRETRTRVKLLARDGTTVERDMEYVEEILVVATETLARERDERASDREPVTPLSDAAVGSLTEASGQDPCRHARGP